MVPDIEECPGGFTIFMFRPLHRRRVRTATELRNDIRSMFGDTKLDEMIKHFVSDNFYLLRDLYELKDMLNTGVQMLQSLTAPGGIALEGYEFGLELIWKERHIFLTWLLHDKLLPVKFGFLLDKAFQNFLSDFSEHLDRSDPIKAARRAGIRGNMTTEIRSGAIPNLVLPASLTNSPNAQMDLDDNSDKKLSPGGTGGMSEGSGEKAPKWWSVLSGPTTCPAI